MFQNLFHLKSSSKFLASILLLPLLQFLTILNYTLIKKEWKMPFRPKMFGIEIRKVSQNYFTLQITTCS